MRRVQRQAAPLNERLRQFILRVPLPAPVAQLESRQPPFLQNVPFLARSPITLSQRGRQADERLVSGGDMLSSRVAPADARDARQPGDPPAGLPAPRRHVRGDTARQRLKSGGVIVSRGVSRKGIQLFGYLFAPGRRRQGQAWAEPDVGGGDGGAGFAPSAVPAVSSLRGRGLAWGDTQRADRTRCV